MNRRDTRNYGKRKGFAGGGPVDDRLMAKYDDLRRKTADLWKDMPDMESGPPDIDDWTVVTHEKGR